MHVRPVYLTLLTNTVPVSSTQRMLISSQGRLLSLNKEHFNVMFPFICRSGFDGDAETENE